MNNGLHCHNILATELAFLEKKYWLLDYVPTRMPKINVVLIFKKIFSLLPSSELLRTEKRPPKYVNFSLFQILVHL